MLQKKLTSTAEAAPAIAVTSDVPVAMAEVKVEVDTEVDVPLTNDTIDDVYDTTEKVAGPSSATKCDVTNWLTEPKQNLVVVIHPWCKFRKSSMDRKSEFPPPGFLENLKAKLQMATVRHNTNEPWPDQGSASAVRRRHCNQKIKYWLQYTAAAMTLSEGPSRVENINATSTAATVAAAHGGGSPQTADLITVWQRYAKTAMASDKTNR